MYVWRFCRTYLPRLMRLAECHGTSWQCLVFVMRAWTQTIWKNYLLYKRTKRKITHMVLPSGLRNHRKRIETVVNISASIHIVVSANVVDAQTHSSER